MDQPPREWTASPQRFGRSLRLLEHLIELIAGVLLILLMALTCADVAGRYLFLAPIAGASEIIALAMGVLIFAALPVATVRGAHLSITLIDRIMPGRFRWPHFGLVQAFSTLALAVLAWRMLDTAAYLGAVNETTTFLGIPKAPVVYLLAIFALMSALLNAASLVMHWRDDRRAR